MSKKAEAWDVFLSGLSQRARAAMEKKEPGPFDAPEPVEDDDDDIVYSSFLGGLSSSAVSALRNRKGSTEAASAPAVPESAVRYGLVECPDGEWAKVRLFKNPEAVARRLQALEGSDTVVWAFYGVPLAVTKGPQRYLMLPDGKTAIGVPPFAGGRSEIADLESLEFEVEEDGYLGPAYFAEDQPLVPKLTSVKGGDDDDDD